MMVEEELTLGRALVKLVGLVKDSSILEDPLYIIRAGAQGQIPIYWRNSGQVWTRLSYFKGDLWKTDSCSRFMQICPEDLARLETSPQTDVLYFALTDQDRALLGPTPPWKASPGEAPPGTTELIDVLGVRHVTEVSVFLGEPGFRHEVSYAAVTISRDQLFVYESDLRTYAATLTPAPATTLPAPAGDQRKSTAVTPDATPGTAGGSSHTEPTKVTGKVEKQWLVANPEDPSPAYEWYIPARYFARETLKEKPTLIANKLLLAEHVSKLMLSVKIKNRGKLKKYTAETILKAFIKVI